MIPRHLQYHKSFELRKILKIHTVRQNYWRISDIKIYEILSNMNLISDLEMPLLSRSACLLSFLIKISFEYNRIFVNFAIQFFDFLRSQVQIIFHNINKYFIFFKHFNNTDKKLRNAFFFLQKMDTNFKNSYINKLFLKKSFSDPIFYKKTRNVYLFTISL